MRVVGTFDAKNKLSELLDLVEHGEEVTITRHGREVARLVPPKGAINRDAARVAAQAIRDMSRGRHARRLENQGSRQGRPQVSLVLDS